VHFGHLGPALDSNLREATQRAQLFTKCSFCKKSTPRLQKMPAFLMPVGQHSPAKCQKWPQFSPKPVACQSLSAEPRHLSPWPKCTASRSRGLSGSWTGFAALLAYGGRYRALAGDATIPEDRPVRPDSERPLPPRLAAQDGSTRQHYAQAPVKPQAGHGQSASSTLPDHPEAPPSVRSHSKRHLLAGRNLD
jgi:hypothetical protein